jgi:hypothetical protein
MNPTSILSGLGVAVGAEPALGSTGSATPGTADLFLALVANLLGDGASTPGPTPDPAAALAEESPQATTPAGKHAGTPDGDVPAVQSPTTAPADLPGLPARVGTDSEDAGTDTDPLESTGATDPGSAGLTMAAALAALVTTAPEPVVAVAATTPAVDRGTDISAAAPGRHPATPGTPSAVPPAAISAEAGDTTSADGQDAAGGSETGKTAAVVAASARAESPATTNPISNPTSASVSTTMPAATAPVSTATATAPTDPHRVIDQVFSQITQVAGHATQAAQRVTVKLNPDNLGEVRIVLTHRQGELHVSLAAGEQARSTLTDGSAELHRLLQTAGHSDSRIVVRDLASPIGAPSTASSTAVAPTAQTAQSGLTGDTTGWSGNTGSGATWSGEERSGQRPAHPQSSGSTTATDGTQVATDPSRRTESAGHRTTGLDLSM